MKLADVFMIYRHEAKS